MTETGHFQVNSFILLSQKQNQRGEIIPLSSPNWLSWGARDTSPSTE